MKTLVNRSALLILVLMLAAAATLPAQTTKSAIQTLTGWQSCTVCAGIGASGPSATYSLVQNQASPSLSGHSAKFSISGKTPYSDALWWKQLGAHNTATHLRYDVDFYLSTPQYAQSLEFDNNQAIGNIKFIFGTQCNIRNRGDWDVWDTKGNAWRPTGIPCHAPSAYKWHHLTWQFKRDGSKNYFVSITLDGVTHYVNRSYYGKPVSASMLDVAFQMDGDYAMHGYHVWLDNVKLTYW